MPSNFLTLTNLSPIGYTFPNYPVKHCGLCKGLLIEECADCASKTKIIKNDNICDVKNVENNWYHNHCYTLANKK